MPSSPAEAKATADTDQTPLSGDDVVDKGAERDNRWWAPLKSREGIVMLTGTLSLFLMMKFGRKSFFRSTIEPLTEDGWQPELVSHMYFSGMSMVTRMLLPLAVIVLILKCKPKDFGFRFNGTEGLGKIYAGLLCFMVPLLWIAAGTESFQGKYPQYGGTSEAWSLLILYEATYFFLFFSGESFWRGFLVFGLKDRYGWNALGIAMIPYAVAHFGKPLPETLGAIVTAYVLGYLAIKHRSWWLGVALHFSIALLMDMFVLIRTHNLPTHW